MIHRRKKNNNNNNNNSSHFQTDLYFPKGLYILVMFFSRLSILVSLPKISSVQRNNNTMSNTGSLVKSFTSNHITHYSLVGIPLTVRMQPNVATAHVGICTDGTEAMIGDIVDW